MTRICEAGGCGRPLKSRQVHYCSRACARSKERKRGKEVMDALRARLPTDAELWEQRHTVRYSDIARSLGESPATVGKLLNDRGWAKSMGRADGFRHAPCAHCGHSYPIPDGATHRICPDCCSPAAPTPVASNIVKAERQRRMPGGDRHAQRMALEPCHVGTHYGPVAAFRIHAGGSLTLRRPPR